MPIESPERRRVLSASVWMASSSRGAGAWFDPSPILRAEDEIGPCRPPLSPAESEVGELMEDFSQEGNWCLGRVESEKTSVLVPQRKRERVQAALLGGSMRGAPLDKLYAERRSQPRMLCLPAVAESGRLVRLPKALATVPERAKRTERFLGRTQDRRSKPPVMCATPQGICSASRVGNPESLRGRLRRRLWGLWVRNLGSRALPDLLALPFG